MARHADTDRLSFEMGGAVRLGGQIGVLTTTVITNATSNQDLQDDLEATIGGAVHGEYRPAAKRISRAIGTGNNADFDLENADITGATTVESLADLTANTDASQNAFCGWLD